MNISSSLSSLAAVYADRSSGAAQRGSSRQSFGASFATEAVPPSGEGGGPRGAHPPGPPPEFDLQRSTVQFAGVRGADPIAALDSDQDGAVSTEEFGVDEASAEVLQLFAAIDADEDGSLSSEEMESFRSEVQQRMQASGRLADPIAALDSDEDGTVSAAEFGVDEASAEVQQLFAAIDADEDSALSSEEVDSFRTQMREALQTGRPMGPPPNKGMDDSGDDRSIEAAQIAKTAAQLTAMLQRMAQSYLSLMEGDWDSAAAGSGGALSASA